MSRTSRHLPGLLVIGAAALYRAWLASAGLDLTDEGFYAAAPLRIALGDTPFVDDLMTTALHGFVPMSWVFRLAPDITLYELRMIGLGLLVASRIALYALMCGYVPPLMAALVAGSAMLVTNFDNILTPGYNLLSDALSCLAVSCWLIAMRGPWPRPGAAWRRPAPYLAGLAGAFMFMAWVSYPTLLAVAVVPAGLAVAGLRWRQRLGRCVMPSLLMLITATAMAGLYVAWLQMAGYLGVILGDFAPEYERGGLGLFWRGAGILRGLWEMARGMPRLELPVVAVCAIGWGMLMLGRPRAGLWASAMAGAGALYFISVQGPTGYGAIGIALIAGASGLLIAASDRGRSALPVELVAGLLWGWTLAVIKVASSSMGLRAATHGMAPLYAMGAAAIYVCVSGAAWGGGRDSRDMSRAGWVLVMASILVLSADAREAYRETYRDSMRRDLTTGFTHPLLRGIRSTPAKVRDIEALLAALDGRIGKGDLLLAYDDIPMIYYLTHTRPAYGVTWATDEFHPRWLNERLVQEMIQRGRVPMYAVRMTRFPRGDWDEPARIPPDSPLDGFVRDNYEVIERAGPFDILELRPLARI